MNYVCIAGRNLVKFLPVFYVGMADPSSTLQVEKSSGVFPSLTRRVRRRLGVGRSPMDRLR
jgi:hypothetical protein